MAGKDKQSKEQRKLGKELRKSKSSENDRARTHGEILRQQVVEGLSTYYKNPVGILISSFTAGLEIGFSYLSLCAVFYFFHGKVEEDTVFKLISFAYPVGFILVILGRSILFTEQTSLLALPVLGKQQALGSLLKLWGLVIIGNLIGGYLISAVLIWIGPRLGVFDLETVKSISKHVIDHGTWTLLLSAVLAGWLMGLLSWLVAASKDTISRIFFVFMITFVLSFAGLHHSIVGNVEVFAGLLGTTAVSLKDYLSFQGVSLLGNALGGTVFVALLKYRSFINAIGN